MAFGPSVAKARSRGHDVRRKLFLRKLNSGANATLKLYGPNGLLAEVTRGWNLELTQRTEFATGERYFNLFIDDVQGEMLDTLKAMTKIRIASTEFQFLSKPSFLNAVPSYVFRVQPVNEV